MTLDKVFSSFSDEKLRDAFKEFKEHEETSIIVKNGILRDIANLMLIEDQSGVQHIGQNIVILIEGAELRLLKEMATRYYNQALKGC